MEQRPLDCFAGAGGARLANRSLQLWATRGHFVQHQLHDPSGASPQPLFLATGSPHAPKAC
eukprot:602953-Prorocentrum_lima.AAC.1